MTGAGLSGCPVLILCGGRGVRLLPLTERVPKGMVPVRGRPLLEHVIQGYHGQGADRFVLCTGYRGEVIRDHFTPPPKGWALTFSHIGEEAGMLQRIVQGAKEVSGRFLLAYGDTIINLDGAQLMEIHRHSGAWATLVTTTTRNPFGLIHADAAGLVTAFEEKPVFTYYIGAAVMEPEALGEVTPELLALPDGQGLVALFHRLIGLGRLGSFNHTGLQVTINTLAEHQEAEAALARYYTYQERDA